MLTVPGPGFRPGQICIKGGVTLIKKNGITLGGLQQKIVNLILFFLIITVGVIALLSFIQYRQLRKVVVDTNEAQKSSIIDISESTIDTVLDTTMTQTISLQAYIADTLFKDVSSDIKTLQTFATKLLENADSFEAKTILPPDASADGTPTVQLLHADGVDPADSVLLASLSNMGEIMLPMFQNYDHLDSCFIGTADGCFILADDHSGANFDENGKVAAFDPCSRPWYRLAAEKGEVCFTGVETDAFSGQLGVVCSAPVYLDGELVAVVGADLFLDSMSEYVNNSTKNEGFICIVNERGQIIFSPQTEGFFKSGLSSVSEDMRHSENEDFNALLADAYKSSTGLRTVVLDGTEYYIAGAPLPTVGWAALSVIEKEITRQPANAMLEQYDHILQSAESSYRSGLSKSQQNVLIAILLILVLGSAAALGLANRIVKPVESMTKKVLSLQGSDMVFEMEPLYKTGDEIEELAKAFSTQTKRTKSYIHELTRITAEKERIGAELEMANSIQRSQLPAIHPPYNTREEFDIFASMTPAKEVGGDFYDFYLIDSSHLVLVMADVSGKGVPAALFMMIARILIKNRIQNGESPGQALAAVNNQLLEGNQTGMFVTVWLSILDLNTGKGTAVNAGHEHPARRSRGGQYDLVQYRHSPAVSVMEDICYREHSFELKPGDSVFVYTDGVAEATNAEDELFGPERMLDALNTDPDAEPKQVLSNVMAGIQNFVKDAQQFDDITMLAFRYNGPAKKKDKDDKTEGK